jgi:hypothetical protein
MSRSVDSAFGLAIVVMLASAAAAKPAQAQSVARTFELRARGGMERQLDAGYRRHLDWHVRAGDRWAWYLWEVVNGDRAGLYVDGTFGHTWADFDAATNPDGDGADNDLNVEPFATRGANHAWHLRPELGGEAVDPEAAPFVLRAEYQVRPESAPTFDNILRRLRAPLGGRPYAVHELVTGGALPTYVLWVPTKSWADVGAVADSAAAILRELAAGAVVARAELWRFRPDLSLCRRAATGCHATIR